MSSLELLSRKQFIRRDKILQSSTIQQRDALLVTCIIEGPKGDLRSRTSEPVRLAPTSLLTTVGLLLDDPAHSDVCFIIRKPNESSINARMVWAARTLLSRFPYFTSSK